MDLSTDPWPVDAEELVALQERLGRAATEIVAQDRWRPPDAPRIGGCVIAFARGEAGPGHPGDRAWAAATVWRQPPAARGASAVRRGDEALRGVPMGAEPRRAADIVDQSVVSGRVPASYAPGLLALREGRLLARAVEGLEIAPEVLLVDATGLDHPRRAGLAVHIGAALGLPTVGVTHRGLVIREPPPGPTRRDTSTILHLAGDPVAAWVSTRSGARPVLVHPGWRTDLTTAVELTLRASTEAARTPVPLQEARRAAREARHLEGGG